jgi:hypothetical protein
MICIITAPAVPTRTDLSGAANMWVDTLKIVGYGDETVPNIRKDTAVNVCVGFHRLVPIEAVSPFCLTFRFWALS